METMIKMILKSMNYDPAIVEAYIKQMIAEFLRMQGQINSIEKMLEKVLNDRTINQGETSNENSERNEIITQGQIDEGK